MLIKAKVFPGCKKEEIGEKKSSGEAEKTLEIRIREKPEKGMANAAVKRALANYFQVPEEKVKVIRGHKQRNKIIKIGT